MTNYITESEYYDRIHDIAKELAIDAMVYCEYDRNQAEEYLADTVHETIDSLNWTIYNKYHKDIVNISKSYNAYLDIYGNEDLGNILAKSGIESILTIQAFWAMIEDTRMLLSDKLEEIQESLENI